MTFTQLHYFTEIVKHKSINAAAAACFISYHAMYKSLKNLERELNITLFNRDSSGVVLTPEGEQFYSDVIKILAMEASWQVLSEKQNQIERAIIKVYANHFFTFTNTLRDLSALLHTRNILLDCFSSYTRLTEQLLASNLASDDTIFISQYHPGKSDLKALAKKYDLKASYLCSDYCKAFLHKSQVQAGQTSISAEELKCLTPILFSNDFSKWLLFDTSEIIDYAKPYHVIRSLPEGLSCIKQNRDAFVILRSSVEQFIGEAFSSDIQTLDIEDTFTGVDFYVLYPHNLQQAGMVAVEELKTYCKTHFSTKKYFK